MKVSEIFWPREIHTKSTAIEYDNQNPGYTLWITYDVLNNVYSVDLHKSGVRASCLIRNLSEDQVNEIISTDNASFVITYQPSKMKK